jgi:inorganic phosphate transporter, PiT family
MQHLIDAVLSTPTLVILVIIVALLFDYINGFHDTANAIATVVSTRVLSPRDAILMAAVLNFIGALFAKKVAQTIAAGLLNLGYAEGSPNAAQVIVLAALVGAIVWNLLTWYVGLPSSSSHALFGGLFGAAFAFGGAQMINWDGYITKALIPIVLSPLAGLLIGYTLMSLIHVVFRNAHPGRVGPPFRWLQIASAGMLAYSHGSNDAQKSMGMITMAIVAAGLVTPVDPSQPDIHPLTVVACAAAMALGTSVGGWRIMKTMGQKIVRLEPVHGFAAQTSASSVILFADEFGAPISTTQVITGSIFGVGSAKRLSAVKWGVAKSMIIAWILTLPLSAAVAALSFYLLSFVLM